MRLLKLGVVLVALAMAGCIDNHVYRDVAPEDLVNNPGKFVSKEDPDKEYIQATTLIDHEDHNTWVTFITICRPKGGCSVIPVFHHSDTYGIHSSTDPGSNELRWKWNDGRTYEGSFRGLVKARVWYDDDSHFLWWTFKGKGVMRDIVSVQPV